MAARSSSIAASQPLSTFSTFAGRAPWREYTVELRIGTGDAGPERMLWHASNALGRNRCRDPVVFCCASQPDGITSRSADSLVVDNYKDSTEVFSQV